MFNFWNQAEPLPDPVDLKAAARDVLAAAFLRLEGTLKEDGFRSLPFAPNGEQLVLELIRETADLTFHVRFESVPGNTFAELPMESLVERLTATPEEHEIVQYGQVSFSASASVNLHSIGLLISRPIAHRPNLALKKKRERRINETLKALRGALGELECFLNPAAVLADLIRGHRHSLDDQELLDYALHFGTLAQAQQIFRRRYEELLVPLSEYDEESIRLRHLAGMPPQFDTRAAGRFAALAMRLGILTAADAVDLPTFADKWQ